MIQFAIGASVASVIMYFYNDHKEEELQKENKQLRLSRDELSFKLSETNKRLSTSQRQQRASREQLLELRSQHAKSSPNLLGEVIVFDTCSLMNGADRREKASVGSHLLYGGKLEWLINTFIAQGRLVCVPRVVKDELENIARKDNLDSSPLARHALDVIETIKGVKVEDFIPSKIEEYSKKHGKHVNDLIIRDYVKSLCYKKGRVTFITDDGMLSRDAGGLLHDKLDVRDSKGCTLTGKQAHGIVMRMAV